MINHIEIYVGSLRESKQFYSQFLSMLGYKLYQEWDKGFSFKLNDFYLVFVQVEDKYKMNGYHRKNIGLNHLAFTVDTKKEVDLIREKLLKEVNELYPNEYPHAGGEKSYAFFFEDPDRLKIEVVAK